MDSISVATVLPSASLNPGADFSTASVPLAWWLGGTPVERALMIGSCLIVLATELLNSAVEAVIERYGPEHHELAGRAKDMGSAAVFVTMLNVLLVWGLILVPRYL